MTLRKKIWWLSTGSVLTLMVCAWFISQRIDSKDWAAWVQAVGSIAAILAAVALAWYQNETMLERERLKDLAELSGLLLSIKDEICMNFEMAQKMVGDELESTADGTGFFAVFPVEVDPFNIYNSLSHRLPIITDEILRRQIIKTYGVAKGAIGTFLQNNELVTKWEAVQRAANKSGIDVDKEDADLMGAQIAQYGDQVRGHYASAKAEVAELLAQFRQRGV